MFWIGFEIFSSFILMGLTLMDMCMYIFCRNLSAIQDREICCYSISCKEKENIGIYISYLFPFYERFLSFILVLQVHLNVLSSFRSVTSLRLSKHTASDINLYPTMKTTYCFLMPNELTCHLSPQTQRTGFSPKDFM